MVSQQTVKITTFWASLAVTVFGSAFSVYVLISNDIAVLKAQTELYQQDMLGLNRRIDSMQGQLLSRTDERFRATDWHREAAKIDARFESMQREHMQEINEVAKNFGTQVDRLEQKIDLLVNRVINGNSK